MRFVPGYRPAGGPDADDYCLLVAGDLVLIDPRGRPPRVRAASAGDPAVVSTLRPIGDLDGVRLWAGAALPRSTVASLAPVAWRDVVATHLDGQAEAAFAAAVVRAVYDVRWCATHRFCGACAAPLEDSPGFATRRCTRCQLYAYVPQRLSPAVLVAVHDGAGDRLLLLRHAAGIVGQTWALLAGFVEAGEGLEDAVRREVFEEVGLDVDEVRYVGSQPWSIDDPGVLLAAFTATARSSTPRVDGVEVVQARWFTPAEVAVLPRSDLPGPLSYASRLIDAFAHTGSLAG
jgi:NAD+ diphosphatase